MRLMLIGTVLVAASWGSLAQAGSDPTTSQLKECYSATGAPNSLCPDKWRGIAPHKAASQAPSTTDVPKTQPISTQAQKNVEPTSAAELPILFQTGSAILSPKTLHYLDALGGLMVSDLAGAKFRIEGHTDTVGADELNQSLSERRAQAVADYLIKTYKIDPARLEPVGKGKTDLIVVTPDQTAEPRNRRVLVVNLQG
jgi:outer membrane protein OmpA-like peptidoglycan-associated protein